MQIATRTLSLLAALALGCGGGSQGSTIGTDQDFEVVDAPAPTVPAYVTASAE